MTKTDKRFWILLIPIFCNSNSKEADTKSANDFQRVDEFMQLKAVNQSVDDVTDEITVEDESLGCNFGNRKLTRGNH